jgi:hypothetical protein
VPYRALRNRWHYGCAVVVVFSGLWTGRRSDLDHRRQGNANGLEQGAGTAETGGTKAKPPPGLIDVGLNDLIEVADDVGPFELTPGSDQTVDQFLTQEECKERAEHMSSNGIVSLVKDRPRVDDGFRGSVVPRTCSLNTVPCLR